jgi:hypothetical protein
MHSPSTRSASASSPRRNSWRLSKTLRRRLDFRPIEDEDIKYAYVAYKKGELAQLRGPFDNGELDPQQFEYAFVHEVKKYGGAWTLFADTRRGYLPVGIVLAFPSTPFPEHCTFWIIGAMLWMPWASKRNKIEASVHFFERIRKQIPMVEYADESNKRFFETIAKHGVMRRVGTMFNVYPNQATSVWETRT